MTREHRVLIVSPYFPPSTLAGVHRARHLAKHLPYAGWTPTVLCVDEAYHTEQLDPGLARLLPQGLDAVKVKALPARFTRKVGIGELGLRAFAQLAAGINEIMRTREPAIAFITGAPFYPMLLASHIRKRYNKPVVLDFQDPWVSARRAEQKWLSKAGMSHALARRLEPLVLKNADFVTSVSDIQNDELSHRNPWFDKSRMAAIPIGGDPDDFGHIIARQKNREVVLGTDLVNFVYVGTLLPRAHGVLKQFFRAIARFRAISPTLSNRVRFTFVGTSNQPNTERPTFVTAIANECSIADLVSEVPGRVPYLDALALLARAEVILLIGSDEPHYTASKIYPALLSGRPSFGLFHNASNAFAIMQRSGSAHVFGFDSAEDLSARIDEMARTIEMFAVDPIVDAIPSPIMASYDARAIAGRFADVFAQVTTLSIH